MDLHRLAFWIQRPAHQVQFFLDVFEIGRAFPLLSGDDGRTTAEPAQRLTKRQVEVEGEVTGALVIRANILQHYLARHLVAELRGGRIGRVTWSRHVVFFDQVEINFQQTHLKLCTVSTSVSMQSNLASGGTPCPRLKICPSRPRISSSRRLASASTVAGLVVSKNGSRLPWTATCLGNRSRTSANRRVQSTLSARAPVPSRTSQFPCTPRPKTITGVFHFRPAMIFLIHCPEAAS